MLVGCSGQSEPEKLAQDACDCVKSHFMSSMGGSAGLSENDLPPCLDDIMATIRKHIKKMDPADRADFIRAFLHAALDTQCATLALQMAPIEKLMQQYLPDGQESND